ncbi:Myb protein I [Phytophthora cinnamomi]|uniref:Myb protein I n=1 Tax=Phytophthora cinnamomi TaxID=4785 RepID=UPI00355AA7B1|nr:Myb protein I [Phytophthora cinnamomi]
MWTAGEHARFLEAVELYPHGPWKFVAAYIGTRSTRQAMTHAQKYRQKLERRRRGLRTPYSRRPKNVSETAVQSSPSFEELVMTEAFVVGAAWHKVEPIPITSAGTALLQTEGPDVLWVDECLSLFVDGFSC